MTDESFDHFITHRRRELEMSLGDVAQALDVSPITVSNWSNGYSLPDSAQLRGLADLLEVPVKDLSDMSGVPIWDGGEDDFTPEKAEAASEAAQPAEAEAPAEAAEAVAEVEEVAGPEKEEGEAERRVQLAPVDAVTPLGEETAEEWLSEEVEASVAEEAEDLGPEPEAEHPITDDVELPTIEAVPEVAAAETSAESDSSVSVLTPPRARDEFQEFAEMPALEPTYIEDSQLLWRYRIRWIVTGVVLFVMLLVLNWAVGNMWDALRSGVESVVPGS